MAKGTGEIPPKCTIIEQGLASGVKLMQCPKVMEYISFSDHCLEEITMLFTCGTTSLPVALLRKYTEAVFLSVHIYYATQLLLAESCCCCLKTESIFTVKENSIQSTFPRGRELYSRLYP